MSSMGLEPDTALVIDCLSATNEQMNYLTLESSKGHTFNACITLHNLPGHFCHVLICDGTQHCSFGKVIYTISFCKICNKVIATVLYIQLDYHNIYTGAA